MQKVRITLTQLKPVVCRFRERSAWKPLITLFLFLSVTPVLASDVLSWDSAMKEAMDHNPDVAAAQEARQSAEAQYKSSYSGFFPQFSANAGYSRGGLMANSGLVIGLVGREQFSVGLSGTEQLFSGFRDSAKVKQARANVEIAEAAFRGAKAKLSADLKTAFAQLLYAEEQVKLTAEIARRRQDNLHLIKLRYEGGRENRGNFLLSEAALAQAQFEAEQAKRAVIVAQQQLAKVLGRRDAEIEIQGELKTRPNEGLPDFRAIALKTPEHLQAERQTGVAQLEIQVARSQFYPTVDLNQSLSRQGENFFPDTDRWSVGLSISFPLFSGGSSMFNLQSARAKGRQVTLTQTSTDDEIRVKLEQTFSSLHDAVGQRHVAEIFLKAAEERATIARGKYTTGLMTFEDWDLIETDLINREKTALTTQRDAVLAEAAWERAQGTEAVS